MGSQLTFYSRDDRISVENQQGTAVSDRLIV
jgi:hypothetical protein